jgi:hypothetical protein
MIALIRATLALFLLSIPLAAQPAKLDPGGWSYARWGMTDAQILDASSGQARRLEGVIPDKQRSFDGAIAAVGVPSLDLTRQDTGRIFFICAPDSGLEEVKVQLADPSPDAFDRLEAALVQKYGRPWSSSAVQERQSQWTFPTTVITLQRLDIRSIGFRSLWLSYARRQAPNPNL